MSDDFFDRYNAMNRDEDTAQDPASAPSAVPSAAEASPAVAQTAHSAQSAEPAVNTAPAQPVQPGGWQSRHHADLRWERGGRGGGEEEEQGGGKTHGGMPGDFDDLPRPMPGGAFRKRRFERILPRTRRPVKFAAGRRGAARRGRGLRASRASGSGRGDPFALPHSRLPRNSPGPR